MPFSTISSKKRSAPLWMLFMEVTYPGKFGGGGGLNTGTDNCLNHRPTQTRISRSAGHWSSFWLQVSEMSETVSLKMGEKIGTSFNNYG